MAAMAAIFDFRSKLHFPFLLKVTSILPTRFRANRLFREGSRYNFKMAAVVAMLDFRWERSVIF